MQRLEAKSIHGRTYYYLSQWGWKNGKCRRLSQKYLGKLEDLAQAVQGTGPAPEYAVVLDWGLPQALWREADRAQVVEHVNQLRSEEHTSELQSRQYLVCRLLLEKKKISLRHIPNTLADPTPQAAASDDRR